MLKLPLHTLAITDMVASGRTDWPGCRGSACLSLDQIQRATRRCRAGRWVLRWAIVSHWLVCAKPRYVVENVWQFMRDNWLAN